MNIHDLVEGAVLKLALIGAVIGGLVHAAREVIEKKYGSWGAWLRGLVASVFTGIVVSLLMDAVELPHAVEMAIVAISVYLADDVLVAMRSMGRMVANDPPSALRRIFDGLRGGTQPKE